MIEYIRKDELLSHVVTEELSDFKDCEVIHLDAVNKCQTYTAQVSLDEVCEYCNERNIEMVAKDWLDSLNASLEEAVNISTAFAESMKAFNARLEELEHETELLEADLQDGVRGYGMNRKCFEVRVKKELLRDILCFMTQAIEEAKEGSGE